MAARKPAKQANKSKPLKAKKKVPKPKPKPLKPEPDFSIQETRRSNGQFTGAHPWAFKPGQSGNPNGRPRKITLSAAFRDKLAETCSHDPARRTWAEVISEALCQEAAMGKVPAAKELREATEGNNYNLSMDWRKLVSEMGGDPALVVEEMAAKLQESLEG